MTSKARAEMHTGDSLSHSVLKLLSRSTCVGRGVLLLVGCLFVCLTRSLTAAETPAGDQAAPQTYRLATVPPDAKEGLGVWIWADKTYDHQIGRLWKDFEIPGDAKVTQARLRIAVDDGYQLYLDGRELACSGGQADGSTVGRTPIRAEGGGSPSLPQARSRYAARSLADNWSASVKTSTSRLEPVMHFDWDKAVQGRGFRSSHWG
jgi:hypothetical protein